MHYLLIDIGNTFSKVAVSDGDQMRSCARVETSCLLEEVRRITESEGKPFSITVSTVRNDRDRLSASLQRFADRVTMLDAFTPMPITVSYGTPQTLGADRVAAAVGAASLFPGQDCLVFDFGTAITIDRIDAKGRFTGGNISPGMSMRFRSMHEFTEKLPLVTPGKTEELLGTDTESAISNGVLLGIIFEVEQYIRKYPDSKIIFTGGDALFFAKRMNLSIFVIYNLVITGLLKVAIFNDVNK